MSEKKTLPLVISVEGTACGEDCIFLGEVIPSARAASYGTTSRCGMSGAVLYMACGRIQRSQSCLNIKGIKP